MFSICDTGKSGGTCVQCTQDMHDFCQGMTPHCDLTTEFCSACLVDSDCGRAGVCLPTGSCADPSTIIHAISTGGSRNTTTCGGPGAGNPCDLDTALLVVQSGARGTVIKLDDAGPYKSTMNNFIVDIGASIGLTIDARNATLHPNADGAIFTINSNAGMMILGGTIEGATGAGGDGIRCSMNGTLIVDGTIIQTNNETAIRTSSCTVTVTNATILNNGGGGLFAGIDLDDGVVTISRSLITGNHGGGINSNKTGFVIVGNVFLGNGDPSGIVGGILFNTSKTGNRLEFNTISENNSQASAIAGVNCSADVNFAAQNNIIWSNNSRLGGTGVQVGGACVYSYSDIGPTALPVGGINGGHNMDADPLFVSDMTDMHLKPGSPVHEQANPGANLTDIASKDLDGKPRVARPGFGADLGAYLVPEQ